MDRSALQAFAQTVFHGLHGYAPCRLLSDGGGTSRARNASVPIGDEITNDLADFIASCEQQRCGAFVVPGSVAERNARAAADVTATAVVVTDVDAGDTDAVTAYLTQRLGAPTLEVASGGITPTGQLKRHLYWRLARGNDVDAAWINIDRICALRRLVAGKVGADASVARPAQVLRIPGSTHFKAQPRPVEVLAYRPGHEVPMEDLEAAANRMATMPGVTAPPRRRYRGPDVSALLEMPHIRQGGVDGVTRHDAITSFIGNVLAQVRDGLATPAEAAAMAHTFNRTRLVPPFDARRIERDLRKLTTIDRRNHGK